MKRIIISSSILIISLAIMLFTRSAQNSLKNIMLAEYTGRVTPEILNAFRSYSKVNKEVIDIGLFNLWESVIKKRNQTIDTTVYGVTGNYMDFEKLKIVQGRFIWDEDAANNRKYAVIEYNTAVKLFSSDNCIGEKITIGNEEYSIVGVYKKDSSFLSLISSVDKIRTYVPIQINENYSRQLVLVKLNDNTSQILEQLIKKDFERTVSAIVNIENIDAKVYDSWQTAALSIALLIVIFAVYALKLLTPLFKQQFAYIKKEFEDKYPGEMLAAYKLQIAAVLIIFISAAVLAVLFLKSIKFQFIINPSILPSRIIDTQEFFEKIQQYIIERNNRLPVVSYYYFLAVNTSKIIRFTGLVIVFSGWVAMDSICSMLWKSIRSGKLSRSTFLQV